MATKSKKDDEKDDDEKPAEQPAEPKEKGIEGSDEDIRKEHQRIESEAGGV